jgi:putative transposase
MKKSRFTDQQVAFALQQAEGGTPVAEVCRKMGISEPTYLYGLLPCRERVSRVPRPGRLAYLYPASRTASGARMANPRAGTSTAGRPTLAWPR